MKITFRFTLLIVVAVFLNACATHTSESENARKSWALGNTQATKTELFSKVKDNEDSGDSLIWILEYAAAARANKDLQASVDSFLNAHNKIAEFEEEPDVKLVEETSAIFTNQSFIPYKGYNYDKIMLGVYQALNYLELKDFDKAAVELKKLENFQINAERLNQERIERETKVLKKAQAQNKDSNYDVNKTLSDPVAHKKLQQIYGNDYKKNTSAMEAKALYVNPFADWLSGVFFMNKAIDNSEKEKAASFLRFASEMTANKSQFILSDLKIAEDFADGKIQKLPDVTYVIYESGIAPRREQIRIDLPLYIIQGDIPHVGINFPYLKKEDSFVPTLNIKVGNEIFQTELIADMDSIITREFNDILPMIITKTIISSAVKSAAQYGIKQAAGDGWGGLAANLALSVYQMAMNDADLRTWTTLPKQIQIARIETPQDGMIIVGDTPIKVNPQGTNIILAKRMSAISPLLLRKFDFSNTPEIITQNNTKNFTKTETKSE